MGQAKSLRVAPIRASDANGAVKRWHYSGTVCQNSQLHLGVFIENSLEGVMQFGPSMDKRKTVALVNGTKWNGFLELNRMAFSEKLPRNSESRAISVAMRIIKKTYPHIEWIISFSDATQCGDGIIYRASGFLLTSIKTNKQILSWGEKKIAKKTLDNQNYGRPNGRYFSRVLIDSGEAKLLPGFQLRYIYFLNPDAKKRLTVPVIPFSRIDEIGAGMYKGVKKSRAGSIGSDASTILVEKGGAIPTSALHFDDNNAE